MAIVEGQDAYRGSGGMVWLITRLAVDHVCIMWGKVARRIGQLQALFIAFGLQIIGIIIPALDNNLTLIMLSGALYGATFIGIVSLTLTMVGKLYPTKPAKPMGKLTLS